MTKINYSIKKQVGIEISGHAGAKRTGGCDLCCAAESILCYTLIDSLQKLKLKNVDIRISDGYVYIGFAIKGIKGIFALLSVKTVINGFELLQKKYPENVYIKKKKEVTVNEQIFN